VIDFLGIGAQKCGTTWLYERLDEHPAVDFPAGKEVRFWVRPGNEQVEAWTGLFPDVAPPTKQGEITPAYALLDPETIEAVHRAAPDVQIFFSMRNPMARAWSAAKMAVFRSEMTIAEASDRWFIDHFNSAGSRKRGDFLGSLDNWLDHYPEDSLQLIFFDDILADPRRVLVDLSEHLGVDPQFFMGRDEDELRAPVHEGMPGVIRPSLLGYLRDLYAPQIEALAGRTGRDLTDWLEWDGNE